MVQLVGDGWAVLHFSTVRPTGGNLWRWQADDYAAAGAWATAMRATGHKPIIVGDFNSTPQATLPRRLMRTATLRDAGTPRSVHMGPPFGSLLGLDRVRWPTWRSGIPGMSLRIDYALVDPAYRVLFYDVGPYLGDHRPLHVALQLTE